MTARGDDLPSWPTIISMTAAALTGVVICSARMFGYMKPTCSGCGTVNLGGRFIIGREALCRSCFKSYLR